MEEDKVNYRVVVIGGSAGSLDVLLRLLKRLSGIPKYALVVVLHRKSGEDMTLEELVGLKTAMPVTEVEDKTPLKPGAIYIAPADYHLLFEKDGTLSLDISEKVNYSRPSIDVTLESAAEAYGKELLAILLSGANADGTEGLRAVQQAGGRVVVQDPASAEIPFMPRNAIENLNPDAILDVEGIADYLVTLPKSLNHR